MIVMSPPPPLVVANLGVFSLNIFDVYESLNLVSERSTMAFTKVIRLFEEDVVNSILSFYLG